jgi:hypothetical protein
MLKKNKMNYIKRTHTLLLLLLIWSTSLAPVIAGPMIICIENGVPCQVESASESCCYHETTVTSDLSYSGDNRDCDHCKDTPLELIAVCNSRNTTGFLSHDASEVFTISITVWHQQYPDYDDHEIFSVNHIPPKEPIHVQLGATPLIC